MLLAAANTTILLQPSKVWNKDVIVAGSFVGPVIREVQPLKV
jgi:hypothetical protein